MESEEKLKNASREWRITFNSISDLIMLVDSEMKIIKANLATARFVHKPIKEIIGKTCYQLFHSEDKPLAVCPFVRMKKTKKHEYAELYLSEKDIWIQDSVDPIFDDEGNLTGSVHIIRDITESKRTEEELKWRLEFEKTITTIFSRFLNMFDIDKAIYDALRDMGILNGANRAYLFLFNEDGTSMNNTHEWCAEGVTPQIDNLQNLPTDMFPCWMRKLRNGEVIHITDVSKLTEEAAAEKKILERQDIKSLLVIPLVSEDKLTGFIEFDNAIITGEWKDEDLALLRISSELIGSIFRRKKADEKLYAYQEQLRYLASQLSLIEEQERRRIATDLHDHIGQTLALCKIKLGTLRESISSNLTQSMDEIRNLLEQTIQYTQSLTFELSSPILYELGFESAVEWLGEQILKKHGIMFYFDDDGKLKLMDDECRIILFQVMRELLVNVVKHSQAQNAKVSIQKNNGNIKISVEDDGIGFNVSKVSSYNKRNGGFGFFSIRERLNYIGGYISIESKPDQGSRVTLVVPLNTKNVMREGE